jgi:hypothetical protein
MIVASHASREHDSTEVEEMRSCCQLTEETSLMNFSEVFSRWHLNGSQCVQTENVAPIVSM